MLKDIFGSKIAGQILIHIYHNGESHASAMAKDFDLALTSIVHQLNRFEKAQILISKKVGRSRLYTFNLKSAYAKPIKAIAEIAYEGIPLKERQKLFSNRRRPRRKGKPVR